MDFSLMPFDVSKPGKLIDNYPELAIYDTFSDPNDDIYLKLAVLITEEQSPVVRAEKNFMGIIVSACNYLKIEDIGFIESLLNGASTDETDKVFNMQSAYFRINNQWEFNTWWDLMFQYHENSLLLRTPLDSTDRDYERKAELKQKIRNHQISLQKDLIAWEGQIFPKATNIKKVLTKHAARITNWPEKMAKEKPSN